MQDTLNGQAIKNQKESLVNFLNKTQNENNKGKEYERIRKEIKEMKEKSESLKDDILNLLKNMSKDQKNEFYFDCVKDQKFMTAWKDTN